MWKIRCAIYSVVATKYSSHHLVCAMSNPDPVKSSVNAVMHDQGSIRRSTWLSFCCRYVDKTGRVIFHIDCHTLGASSGLSHVKYGTSQIQRICSFAHSSLIFKWVYLRFYSKYVHNRMHFILHICCQIQHTSDSLHIVKTGLGEIQRDCSFGY